MRGIAIIGVVGAFAVALVPAAGAQPGSGPRETINETFTTTQPRQKAKRSPR